MAKERILMAMSGGVDSSVAASLLLQQGYEVVGATLQVWSYEKTHLGHTGTADDSQHLRDAKALAGKLDIEHHILDVQEEFEQIIIRNFIDEYLQGRTPNPCCLCNPTIKWRLLLDCADKLHCDKIASGHYVQLKEENGRYFVAKGSDTLKDQSYVLWNLSQDQLSRTLFPLGTFKKEEIKQMAIDFGYPQMAQKAESFDICFIPDGNYRSFLQLRIPEILKKFEGGIIENTQGKVLGKHKGFPFYTIGQRKGLEVAVGHPIYVTKIDAENNKVILGEKEDLLSEDITLTNCNLLKYNTLPSSYRALVKIRYHNAGEMANISMHDNIIECHFDHPVSAVTPGQSAVIYEGDDVVGGGIIC